ncbi:MAG: DUF4294 domain-containing protein [Mangrovibacterium sp.]
MIRYFSLIAGLGLMLSVVPDKGQAQEADSLKDEGFVVEQGDSLPHVMIRPVFVMPRRHFDSRRDLRKYWRLAAKVRKVYPYAQKAAELLGKYNAFYLAEKDPKKRRKYVKQIEAELFEEYGPQLKKLSLSEGRILIKLIDRETQETSYELIRDLKGGLAAFFWQGVARLFGHDLKDEYDPVSEDRMIEEIIFFIETGVF